MARRVVIVGFPGVQALDVVGPHDVFTGAALLTGGGYDVVMSSVDGQPVTTATGLAFLARPLPDPSEEIDTVVLPGGGGVDEARSNADLMRWIKSITGSARRVVSVCTGAFLAAQAGLLDGRRATTHWAFAGRLAREFPAVDVDPDPIFVRSSDTVWTAAGVTAGIDLALSLVEDDHGTDVAQTVARWLVLYLRRPGGQTQ
ncbi:MAG TPA: AraC family transcriptional regulator, partial [Mycobacterium sp.]|nr:AraC family transcriptional regulator [Mycobacterium sp.]